MIIVHAQTPNLAWQQCLQLLTQSEQKPGKYYRDELAIIEILEPCIEIVPKEFPMPQFELDIINNYIISGENEAGVSHEWTKVYFHRIYDQPYSQYRYFVQQLSQEEQSGRAQISLWDKTIDQTADIAPCTQIIWGRIKNQQLEFHVHAHSVDAYKKLLMNQQEFITLQQHIAHELSVSVGKFYHIIDSCHIYATDASKISFDQITSKASVNF